MLGYSHHRRYLFWLALGTATMALVMAILLVFALAQRSAVERNAVLRADSLTAPAFECEREYLRFRQQLNSVVHGRQVPDMDALTLHYDLFLSRVTLLRDSPNFSTLMAPRQEYRLGLPKLEQWVQRANRVMADSPPDSLKLAALLVEVNAMETDVHALSVATNSAVAHLMEKQSRDLIAQTEQIVALTLAQMILLMVAATALFARQKRQEQERLALEVITEDLRKANLRAQATMEELHLSQEELARSETKAALSTVIASVSHELSTPLGNSLMMAGTLVAQGQSFQQVLDSNQLKRSELVAFAASVREGNDLMLRNLERAVALLKNFRQVVNDQASGQRRAYDLSTVVQEIIDTLAPSLKRHKHRIHIDIAGGIIMDSLPGTLGQVIINLVNNAYLHAFEGRTEGVLRISAKQGVGRVTMEFEDDGVGMSEETLQHVFEPFFSTKKGQGGTGLGMSIVADLVRKTLGGEIEVKSTVGVGTVTRLDLPLVLPAQNPERNHSGEDG